MKTTGHKFGCTCPACERGKPAAKVPTLLTAIAAERRQIAANLRNRIKVEQIAPARKHAAEVARGGTHVGGGKPHRRTR